MIDIHIDIETYCHLELTEVGTYKYADYSEIQIFGFAIEGGPVIQICPDFGEKLPADLIRLISTGEVRLWAHTAEFEWCNLNGNAGALINFPKTDISQWRCTQALANSLALPGRLDKLGEVLGVREEFRKLDFGTRLINFFAKPHYNKDSDEWYVNSPVDHVEKFKKYLEYNKSDIFCERENHRIMKKYELKPPQQRAWEETIRMNERGIPIDLATTEACKQHVENFLPQVNSKAVDICELNLSQVTEIRKWCNQNLPKEKQLPNLQEKTIRKFLQSQEPIPEDVKRILELRLEFTSAAIKKLHKAIVSSQCDHERFKSFVVRGCYSWHGPTTGRWAAYGFQPQNLFKPLKEYDHKDIIDWALLDCKYRKLSFLKQWYGNPLKLISSCIRSLIMAPEGYDIMVSDYSAIEFCILCAITGEKEALEVIRTDGPGTWYKKMAASIYEVPIEEVASRQRALGKQSVLGFGYGMSARKFRVTCEGYEIEVPPRFEFRAHKLYHKTFPKVKQFHKELERAIKQLLIDRIYDYPIKVGEYIQVFLSGKFLFIQLPSGRKLAYPKPRIGPVERVRWTDEFGEEREFWARSIQFLQKMGLGKAAPWGYDSSHGGKFTENICQAISADITCQGWFNLIDSGTYYPFGFSHDEVMSLKKKGEGSLEEYNRLLCKMGPWAKEIPVQAAGEIQYRYRKI